MEKMFEYAAKNKLRFQYKGMITVEDLYTLNREALNAIHESLYEELQHSGSTGSLITSAKTKQQEELEIKLAIVKYIFNQKTQELADKIAEKEAKEEVQLLTSILKEKENESLKNMSVEELKKRIAELS